MDSKFEMLEKLNELYQKGVLSESEFLEEKAKILREEQVGTTSDESSHYSYSSLLHLSNFASYIIPFSGLIVMIVMWASRKNESEFVDKNGKIILNWKISTFIYSVVIAILGIVLLGTSIFSLDFFDNLDNVIDDSSMFPGELLGIFGILGSVFSLIIPLLLIAMLDFIFTIIGAVKASSGNLWNYPFSIRFFKI